MSILQRRFERIKNVLNCRMKNLTVLRAVNGVVSFIKPPLSLLLNYPPFNLKLIEYYYPSINALCLSILSLPIQ